MLLKNENTQTSIGRSSTGTNANPIPSNAKPTVAGHVKKKGSGSLYEINAKMPPAHK